MLRQDFFGGVYEVNQIDGMGSVLIVRYWQCSLLLLAFWLATLPVDSLAIDLNNINRGANLLRVGVDFELYKKTCHVGIRSKLLPFLPVSRHELVNLGIMAEPHDLSLDRKSTRLNSSHANISYAVF